ncbi:MAG: hypothetical protein ACM3H8_09715, partial [Sphingobacteriales bacterium]
MKKISLSISLLLFSITYSLAQTPGIQWQQTLGTKDNDGFSKVIKTNDGGILLVGYKAQDSTGYWDMWVVKKSADGVTEWEKTFGLSGDDYGSNAIQTADGDFVIAGTNSSTNYPGHHGVDSLWSNYDELKRDVWVIKISGNGSIIWQKLIGGKDAEEGFGICEDLNNNIYVSGWTNSEDGDFLNKKKDSLSYDDAFIAKLSSNGDLLQIKCFGGNRDEYLSSIVFKDNELVTIGRTGSNDLDVSGLHPALQDTLGYIKDIWFVRLDASLDILKQKCFGGNQNDFDGTIKALQNGNFLFCGYTASADGDVIGHSPILSGLE